MLDVAARAGRDGGVKPCRLSIEERWARRVARNAVRANHSLAGGVAAGAIPREGRVRRRKWTRADETEDGGALRGTRSEPSGTRDGEHTKEHGAYGREPASSHHHRSPR